MIYYFLFADLLALILVYIVYVFRKNNPQLTTPTSQLLYIPTLISLLIIVWYYLNGSNNQVEIRKNEYIAVGMKYYKNKNEVFVINEKNIYQSELFTGIYKDSEGVFREFEITKPTYNYFKSLWSSKKEFEISSDELRNVYFIEWDKNPKTSLIFTKSDVFTNYFKTTMSLYDQVSVTENDVKRLRLFPENRIDYVNKSNILEPRQSLIYGIQAEDSISRYISNLSGLDLEFRPILLVWSGENLDSEEIIKYQRSYWGGGKNNEVVFCVGINNEKERKILWSGSFSWAISNELENYVLNKSLKPGNILSSRDYYESVMSGYSKNYWNPRNFEAYTVMGISIMDFMIILMSILIIICNFVILARFNYQQKKLS